MHRPAAYLGVLIAVLLLWWGLTFSVAPLLLPPLPAVGEALRDQLRSPGVWAAAMGTTGTRTVCALLIASVLAIPIGVLVGRSRLLTRAYEPMLAAIAAVPLVVLYPVLAATLGIGTASKIALGALYAFFPVAIATVRAVGQVDPSLVTAMIAMGGRGRTTRTVLIPSALPGIVSGLRTGLGLALVTIIAAEFIAGDSGVGYQLAAAGQGYQSAGLFAWVVLAVALTIAIITIFTGLTSLLERMIRR